MSKSKLSQAIISVNNRYRNNLNDDDQVKRMITIDRTTKGYSFWPNYDYYSLITDQEKLERYILKFGYWSDQVKQFNEILKIKGSYEYMVKLNNEAKYKLKPRLTE